jgi:hypothetical protein
MRETGERIRKTDVSGATRYASCEDGIEEAIETGEIEGGNHNGDGEEEQD